MHVHITSSETGNNKGSSGGLVNYLEKESRLAEENKLQPEYWFNHQSQEIQAYEVRLSIDNNIGRLSRDEAKFFLVNISPSEYEIAFLKDEYGDKEAKEMLKQYALDVMDEYAVNFRRPNINNKEDLVYFAKLENNRYYSHRDEEVKKGLAQKGEPKPGEQMHVQIIVSRKDVTDSIKLSPLNNSRGKNQAHSLKVGQFDRSAFKEFAEQAFDRKFDYDRELWETFRYANTLKHGSVEQKVEMIEKDRQEQQLRQQQRQEYEQRLRLQQEREQSQRQSRGMHL